MRHVIRVTLAAAVAIAAFLAGSWYEHRAAPRGGSSGRKILHYVDPMHPAYTSDRPGTAPDCGMALEPVYADGGPPPADGAGASRPRRAGTVALTAERQQLFGVRVATVERVPSRESIRLFGRVVPDENRVFTLNAAMEGSIRELSGVTTGARVHEGQWLGSFFSADSRTPLQAYITALDVEDLDPLRLREAGARVAAGATASSSAQFTIERLLGMGMSRRQIEEIRRTRRIPLTIGIYAPADGFVLARNVSLGQKFERGAEWFRIAALDKVWILADLLDRDAPYVRPGMSASITVPSQRAPIAAKVAAILPQFDGASRTLKVRLEAANPGYALRPEMLVDVSFAIDLPAATTIPSDALVDSGRRKVVFVEQGDGIFEPRDVEIGWRFGDRLEVVHGLSAGDRIVVSSSFLMDSESRLRAAAAGVHGRAAVDPVCGMEVDQARAAAAGRAVEHGGKTYHFCSDQCRSRFGSAPGQFAAAPPHDHAEARADRRSL